MVELVKQTTVKGMDMRFSAWIAACCIGMGLGASADASQTWTFRTGLAFSDKNADRHREGE